MNDPHDLKNPFANLKRNLRILGWLFALAHLLVATVASQTFVVENRTEFARDSWITAAVPIDVAVPAAAALDGAPGRVVRGRTVGRHSRLVHLRVEMPPRSRQTVRVGGERAVDHFYASDWVADNLFDLVPTVCARVSGITYRMEMPSVALLEAGPARQVFHLRARVGGTMLVADSWLYVYAGQDVVHVELRVTQSDPRRLDLNQPVDLLWVETGEFLRIRHAHRVGVVEPFRLGNRWVTLLGGPLLLGDGQSMPFWGSMLCLPASPAPGHAPRAEAPSAPAVPTDFAAVLADAAPAEEAATDGAGSSRLDSLLAENFMAALGCAEAGTWSQRWGPFRSVPQTPVGTDAAATVAARWLAETTQTWNPGGMFDTRAYGLAKHTGQTGSQEGFGAGDGWGVVTVGDPGWLHWGTYHLSEFFRPVHKREADASVLRAAAHPNWRTWSQLTHSTGTDKLGKKWPMDEVNHYGWGGNDDQHRANLELTALYALTGSYLLENEIDHLVEVDNASATIRMPYRDAARAFGRLLISWAWFDVLTDRADVRRNMEALTDLYEVQWTHRTKQLCPLDIYNDPRQIKVPDTAQGTPVDCWLPWQESIAAMGAKAAYGATGEARWRGIAKQLSYLVTLWGTFKDENGVWRCCSAVRWKADGTPIDAAHYRDGNREWVHIYDGFWTWQVAAVLIAREIAAEDGDANVVERADAILAQQACDSHERSCWWAVVPR